MYSAYQLAKKFAGYYVKASNGKGHGVHSPFVFDFIIHVLNDKKEYPCYKKLEAIREQLLNNENIIEVEDFGAGSAVIPFKKRKISAIASSSLKKKKYARLLFRMAQYYQVKNIVELGTSFGVTTSYLAAASPEIQVTTFEGAHQIVAIALETFKKANLNNINLIEGDFKNTLNNESLISQNVDFLFIDGNHRKAATLDYFELFLNKRNADSIFIFDDIHWSREMEEAWEQIQQHDAVTLTIDLFFIGIVLFKKDFKVKQHFTIRF